MDKGGGVVAHGVDRGAKVFRLAPMAVCPAMADIDIIAPVSPGAVAGEIEVSFVGGEGRGGFPGFGINAVAQVFRRTPAVGGEIGDIEITTAVSVREIATGEDEPLSILGNVLGSFVLVGIDISGQAFGLAPQAVHFVGFIKILVIVLYPAGVDQFVAVDGDGGIVFGDIAVDAVSHVLRFEFVVGDGPGTGIIEGELVA